MPLLPPPEAELNRRERRDRKGFEMLQRFFSRRKYFDFRCALDGFYGIFLTKEAELNRRERGRCKGYRMLY